MPEDTKYIKFTDSFKLSLDHAISLVCLGRWCVDCPLSDCSNLADSPTAIAELEQWIRTRYCVNAGTEYAETDQFVCSACGLHLQDWTQIVSTDDPEDPTLSEYTFRYCPQCGRKILPAPTED